jgi:hypothetical protein
VGELVLAGDTFLERSCMARSDSSAGKPTAAMLLSRLGRLQAHGAALSVVIEAEDLAEGPGNLVDLPVTTT